MSLEELGLQRRCLADVAVATQATTFVPSQRLPESGVACSTSATHSHGTPRVLLARAYPSDDLDRIAVRTFHLYTREPGVVRLYTTEYAA